MISQHREVDMQFQMSKALVPSLIGQTGNDELKRISKEALSFIAGFLVLSGLAQFAIQLPWTPVPITGQTLGVAILSLSWGKTRAPLIVLIYLLLGALGLPIFAAGTSGLILGPTLGYLLGMLAASFVMGGLADRGWTRSLALSFGAAYIGSALTFFFGLLVLSFFLPKEQLLMAGLLPFLPGDFIKNMIAAIFSSKLRSKLGQ